MEDQYEYECALSGVSAEGSTSWESDGMADCPPGWVQVTMKRRLVNPRYMALLQTKETIVAIGMQQIPENVTDEIRTAQRAMMVIQTDANFHALEAETPPYLTYEEMVYIAPPETNPDILEAFNEVREGVGLDLLDGSVFEKEEENEAEGVAAETPDPGQSSDAAPEDELEEIESEG